MKHLVTGHSGLLGSHLCDILLAEGHEVYGISTSERNQNSEIKNLYFDILNSNRTCEEVRKIAPEYVWHLAANAAEGKSMFSPIEISSSNYNTFMNVLVGAIQGGNLKRFNFTSSIAIYGAIHTPYREQDLPLPQDIYGINKLAIEQSLKVMADVHKFEYTITRPHNVYGERQRMDDLYRNVLAIWMNLLMQDKEVSIYGDGTMRRSFSYVKDVVDVIHKAGVSKFANMTFNIGSDYSWSLNEAFELVRKAAGKDSSPVYLPSRVHETHTAVSDHTLANALFGYKETQMAHGILRMWEYAKKLGPQVYKLDTLELPNSSVPQNWRK